MWFHFGRVVGEYRNLNKLNVGENILIQNEENLIQPLRRNRNCIFFSAHIGNWGTNISPSYEKWI